jgi:hypothetical protein
MELGPFCGWTPGNVPGALMSLLVGLPVMPKFRTVARAYPGCFKECVICNWRKTIRMSIKFSPNPAKLKKT